MRAGRADQAGRAVRGFAAQISTQAGRRAWLGGMRAAGFPTRQIGGAVPVDHALHAIGHQGCFGFGVCGWFERGDTATGADHSSDLAAGLGTPHHHAGGVDIVIGGVTAQPAQGGFHILDCGGKMRFARQAVIHASHHIAFGGQRGEGGRKIGKACQMPRITGRPVPAMDKQDQRTGQSLRLGWCLIKIQGQWPKTVHRGVNQIAVHDDPAGERDGLIYVRCFIGRIHRR